MLSLRSFERAILHIDGDSFFAGCEVAKDPSLRGKPVVVGKERGMSTAMTYEAKARGIKRGMPIRQIKELCPDAIILPSDYETYSLYSKRMFSIVERYTSIVEEYSIDECFAELTGLKRSLRMTYPEMASRIKKDLDRELGMTFSIGLAPTKVLAKVASKWKKPSGLTILAGNQIHLFLEKLPVEKIWGIGSQTTAFLRNHKVITALQFALRPEAWIKENLTKPFWEIWKELHGDVVYEVETATKQKQSITKTKTFTPPSSSPEYVYAQLSKNVENVCIKIRDNHLASKQIFFYLKTQDFKYEGMEVKLSRSTDIATDILKVIGPLFPNIFKKNTLYRGTGIELRELEDASNKQSDLFGDSIKADTMRKIYEQMDSISKKYGKHTLFLGSSFQAIMGSAHKGDRGDNSYRASNLFKGENKRKRVGLPLLGEAS